MSRRNVELQEVRQIRRTIVVYRFKGKEKQFVFNSLFNRKPVKIVKDGRYVIKLKSSTDEPCSIVLNFLKFVNELLRTHFHTHTHTQKEDGGGESILPPPHAN